MGWSQGKYEVINKDKYCGSHDPTYRSSWELAVFRRMDTNPNVLKWGAEVVVVDYFSPADKRPRRYFVDLYVEYLHKGKVKTEIIEIKPYQQTIPPEKKRGKKKDTYLKEVYTYTVNRSKWEAAAKYAAVRGWSFKILTEKNIFR